MYRSLTFSKTMKKTLAFVVILIVTPLAAFAQSVTTGALSTTSFCQGATVSVIYTASGTFGAKNVFTVQLSAPDGSFTPSFQNIGQVKSATSGSITATLSVTPGTHYRLRVASSNPYIVGNDNGSDITVDAPPLYSMGFGISKRWALVGDTIVFDAEYYPAGSTFTWHFDLGATPPTSSNPSPAVVYSSAGLKHIDLTAVVNSPCISGTMDTSDLMTIFDCNPAIPSDAYIDSVSAGESSFPDSIGIWVVPGGALNLASYNAGPWISQPRPIFAEAGTTISGGSGHVIYLKPGAVYTGGGDNIIINSPGASSPDSGIECSSLAFDYTNAPPYKIIPAAGVEPAQQAAPSVNIYPNPAHNIITVESQEIPTSISVRNELGEEVLSDRGPLLTSRFQFDISQFANGVYYVMLNTGHGEQVQKFTVSR